MCTIYRDKDTNKVQEKDGILVVKHKGEKELGRVEFDLASYCTIDGVHAISLPLTKCPHVKSKRTDSFWIPESKRPPMMAVVVG